MTQRTINPQLMLAGAEMAFSEHQWRKAANGDIHNLDWDYFRPHNGGRDAFALERALKKKGWHFSWNESFDFYATNLTGNFSHEMDPSDTLLLLKCVSAQTNIPMFAEVGSE